MTTDDDLRGLFAAHCECRPINTARLSHSHDCGTAITNDVRIALHGMMFHDGESYAADDSQIRAARVRCEQQLWTAVAKHTRVRLDDHKVELIRMCVEEATIDGMVSRITLGKRLQARLSVQTYSELAAERVAQLLGLVLV